MNIPLSYRVNFDQFCEVIREHHKADLIGGVIHMASPENLRSNCLSNFLAFLMNGVVEHHASGALFTSRVAFRLDSEHAPEPDLAFVRTDRLGILREGYVDGRPDLAMEIVSPESVERDHTDKRDLYARFGVPEYWIVDPLEEKVTLFRVGPRQRYRSVRPQNQRFLSQVIPGWWLRPEWLWQDPLPAFLPTLREILGESALE